MMENIPKPDVSTSELYKLIIAECGEDVKNGVYITKWTGIGRTIHEPIRWAKCWWDACSEDVLQVERILCQQTEDKNFRKQFIKVLAELKVVTSCIYSACTKGSTYSILESVLEYKNSRIAQSIIARHCDEIDVAHFDGSVETLTDADVLYSVRESCSARSGRAIEWDILYGVDHPMRYGELQNFTDARNFVKFSNRQKRLFFELKSFEYFIRCRHYRKVSEDLCINQVAVQWFGEKWSPELHKYFPIRIQENIHTTLLVMQRIGVRLDPLMIEMEIFGRLELSPFYCESCKEEIELCSCYTTLETEEWLI